MCQKRIKINMKTEGDNIIAFFGRARSGKGVLSAVCEEFGYTPIAFATPLKTLISRLIHVSLEDIEELKTAYEKYVFNEKDFNFISNETDIPFDIVKEKLDGVEFHNTRELMQIIGTDLIRNFNVNWHVNKTKETILSQPNKKFVITDGRFPNEKQMVEELNGSCWFIVRPTLQFVSHHTSEESVKWQEFNNVIINNKTVEHLQFLWHLLMENGYLEGLKMRQNIVSKCYEDKTFIDKLGEPTVQNEFNFLDALFINKFEFTYNSIFLNNDSVENVQETNGLITVKLKNEDNLVTVSNPLEIEDLKIFV